MALYKEITDDNGVVSKYFRISNVDSDIDKEKINISVIKYVDEEYRNKEKEIKDMQAEVDNKRKIIEELNKDYENNSEEIIKQNQELWDMTNKLNTLISKNYFVKKEEYDFDFENKSYSMSDYYNLLKQLEIFSDSVDV